MAIWIVLIIIAYLLGSVPLSYLVAKRYQAIDLRRYGTNQVGTGNLWRMTSWRVGILVGIFDLCKGMAMVWAAQAAGLDLWQQLAVGMAAVIGHNWPVFLRFHGGRGIATTVGVVIILSGISGLTPLCPIVFLIILGFGTLFLHSTPLPVLIGVIALPVISSFYDPLPVTLCFIVLLLIVVVKRMTAQQSVPPASVSRGQLIFNRLFFDRDISDRKVWMYRAPVKTGTDEPPPEERARGED